jgi:hypothetical protein
MGKPEHVVDIYDGQKLVKSFGVGRNQTVIPMRSDSDPEPGF